MRVCTHECPELQGRVIPVFASEIYDQNKQLAEVGLVPVNLSSIIIGKLYVTGVACLNYITSHQ